MDRLYFAYGSNLSLQQMRRRCSNAKPLRRCVLPGFKLVLRGAADVEPCAGGSVEGALYWVSQDDEAQLDSYEGVPNLYSKRTFAVEEGEALFYQMDPPIYKEPREGYIDTIRNGFADWDIPLATLESAIREQTARPLSTPDC